MIARKKISVKLLLPMRTGHHTPGDVKHKAVCRAAFKTCRKHQAFPLLYRKSIAVTNETAIIIDGSSYGPDKKQIFRSCALNPQSRRVTVSRLHYVVDTSCSSFPTKLVLNQRHGSNVVPLNRFAGKAMDNDPDNLFVETDHGMDQEDLAHEIHDVGGQGILQVGKSSAVLLRARCWQFSSVPSVTSGFLSRC